MLIKVDLMMMSSICVRDVAANNLLRSTSQTLLELTRKLFLAKNPKTNSLEKSKTANLSGLQQLATVSVCVCVCVYLCDRMSFFMLSAKTKL